MRAAFLLALLLASGFYTYVAFVDLNFLSMTGRLGPGFFPRIIGVLLVAVSLWAFVHEVRTKRAEREGQSDYWGIVLAVVVLSGLFVALLHITGGTLAMAIFLFAALSFLNRGHLLQNIAIAILLPAGIYYLFDVWLNASMPEGIVPLPI